MRALNIDFQARRGPGWLAIALFVAGLAAMLASGLAYQRVQAELARLDARLRPMRAALVPDTSTVEPAMQDRWRAAVRTGDMLRTRWFELLAELEANRPEDVVWLVLEAEQRGQLRFVGETKTFAAIEEAARRLRAAPGIRNVDLAQHEVHQLESERLIGFTLAADWVAVQGRRRP